MKPEHALALAFIFTAGFAIQRAVEILEPLALWLYAQVKVYRARQPLTDLTNDKGAKSTCAHVLSFLLGLIVVVAADFRFLIHFHSGVPHTLDLLVTALAVGSGTDFANSVVKYLQYVKDAQKPSPSPAIEVVVTAQKNTLKVGEEYHFLAAAKNAPSPAVIWVAVSGEGGTITSEGLFVSTMAGECVIQVASKNDPSVFKLLTITVTP